jgi:hypothetical protein
VKVPQALLIVTAPAGDAEPQVTVQLTPSKALSLVTVATKLTVWLTAKLLTAVTGAPVELVNSIGPIVGLFELAQPLHTAAPSSMIASPARIRRTSRPNSGLSPRAGINVTPTFVPILNRKEAPYR